MCVLCVYCVCVSVKKIQFLQQDSSAQFFGISVLRRRLLCTVLAIKTLFCHRSTLFLGVFIGNTRSNLSERGGTTSLDEVYGGIGHDQVTDCNWGIEQSFDTPLESVLEGSAGRVPGEH